jgi:LacI family transcriptional regulator
MHTHDPLIPSLLKRALPFILVGRYPADERVSFVDVDNSDAAREATAYLFRLGYRRVATIAGPQQMIAGHDRLQGYLEALHARGVAPDPDLIAESDFTEQGGYAAMQQLLFRGRRAGLERSPDAVFVASDTMALGALRALHEAGKRVPDDVALIGFDDMPFAAHTDPPLTTVRQPIPRAGSVAAETLFDIIEHPAAPPRRILLNTELVIRASTGDGV